MNVPRKDRSVFLLVGFWTFWICWRWHSWGRLPSSLALAAQSLDNRSMAKWKYWRWVSWSAELITMSSRYTRTNLWTYLGRTSCTIKRWKVTGAPLRPKGLSRNWHSLENAVYYLLFSFIDICPYIDRRSIVEKTGLSQVTERYLNYEQCR